MVGPMRCFAESVCWDVSPGRALRSHVTEPQTVTRLRAFPPGPRGRSRHVLGSWGASRGSFPLGQLGPERPPWLESHASEMAGPLSAQALTDSMENFRTH